MTAFMKAICDSRVEGYSWGAHGSSTYLKTESVNSENVVIHYVFKSPEEEFFWKF
jgi:hypothetical protein